METILAWMVSSFDVIQKIAMWAVSNPLPAAFFGTFLFVVLDRIVKWTPWKGDDSALDILEEAFKQAWSECFTKRLRILLLLLLLILPVIAQAAGSACTGVNNGLVPGSMSRVIELQYSWTSDDTEGSVDNLGGITGITGTIIAWRAVPGTSSEQPTADYDVTVVDGNGATLAALDNLPNTLTGANYGALGSNGGMYVRNATIGLSVANAGNSKEGVVYLYVRIE